MKLKRKAVVTGTLLLMSLVLSRDLHAANPRSYIEAVRRQAAVVYLGEVREVTTITRERLNFEAQAQVEILEIARSPEGEHPAIATVKYHTWDDETPPHAGGPQYRLEVGTLVLVFAASFDAPVPPGSIVHGEKAQIVRSVTTWRDSALEMDEKQLEQQEITELDRKIQIGLYDRVLAFLATD